MANQMYALKSPAFYLCPRNMTSKDVKDAIHFTSKADATKKAAALNVKRSPLNQLTVVPIEEAK